MKQGETGASSGEEPSAEAPAAGLAAEFAPTPWQDRWGGAGKRPGRNSLRFPRPGAGVVLRGLLRAMCPRPKCLGGDIDHTARCHRVPPAGEIKPNKGSGSAQTCRAPPSPVSSRSSPSSELGARASVCKQTGHVAEAARSPPLAPQEPLGRSRGISSTSPQPSWAAWCAGARPPSRRTARTRADSAPRPRATGQRSLYLATGCPVPPAPGSAAPECLATKDCTADSGARCALLKPQSPPPPPPLPLRIPPSPGRGLAG